MTQTTMLRSEQMALVILIPIDCSIPRVVGLDGTLLLTDILHEFVPGHSLQFIRDRPGRRSQRRVLSRLVNCPQHLPIRSTPR